MANDRNAGRKRRFSDREIKKFHDRYLNGERIQKLAGEAGVSRQTMSFYIKSAKDQEMVVEVNEGNPDRLIIRSLSYWNKLNRDFVISQRLKKEEAEKFPLRMDFMNGNECVTVILVNMKEKEVRIINYSDDILHRAFGVNLKPTWEEFQDFLGERVFPRTRGHMKLILKDLDLDFYDPLTIIEKTKGLMAEDNQWIRLKYLQPRS